MFETIASDPKQITGWGWAEFEPYFKDLSQRILSQDTVKEFLDDWSQIRDRAMELEARLSVAVSVDTSDEVAEQRYKNFYETIFPRLMEAEQALKEKLLASNLQPQGYEIPLRNMRAEAELFRPENLPLIAQETNLQTEYDKIMSRQTVQWEGEERTISQMGPVMQDSFRATRERAWRLVAERQLADRNAINEVWAKLVTVRLKKAANADMPDYRAYRWKELLRFDYTPEDARSFHSAIEEVVVPAAKRIYERRRERLGVETLRPWDLTVDAFGQPPLRPFTAVDELTGGVSRIFHRVDPTLGKYFDTMQRDELLDLGNRKNKAPGGYCTGFPVIKRPFIFMNAVGLHDDVQTLLHEGGHAFHVFESASLPNHLQNVPIEFAEVASMGMELLAAPYLMEERGGFYTLAESARARIEHLEGGILFWPYMAVVDAFQHWVYENPEKATNPAECDAAWSAQWKRFMVGVDWTGLEAEMATGWHRKLHIHTYPFYYIEYGLAQLGAVQVWANALKDQAGAVSRYRKALALGGSTTLPDLFTAAGARFGFNASLLRQAVSLMENTIWDLESRL